MAFLLGRSISTKVSRQSLSQCTRRWASDSSAQRESAFDVPGGSGSESFGVREDMKLFVDAAGNRKGFYIVLSSIPLGMIGWTLSTSSDGEPWLTRFLDSIRENEKDLERRNTLHIAALEQAAADRHLYFSGSPSRSMPYQLRFPEIFNSSSPWNVTPGQGGADLTQLMEHYKREQEDVEQERLARMKNGEVHSVYDDTTGGRLPSWVPLFGGSKKVDRNSKE